MKWNFSPVGVALFSFRRWHWLRGLRQVLTSRGRRASRSKDKPTEQRALLRVDELERRESVGGDCSPLGVWLAASGMVGGLVLTTTYWPW
jgi:hypothetical protein